MLWIALGFIVAAVLIVVTLYNRLVVARNQVRNLWRQIDVQLKRRYDLIPNLVNAVRDAMQWEKDTLTDVIEARSHAVNARTPEEAARADSAVTAALGQIFALVEKYPELQSNAQVRQLMADLTATENAIAGSRAVYNGSVRDYTNLRETVPSAFIASLFNFEPAAYFEAAERDRETPRVALR